MKTRERTKPLPRLSTHDCAYLAGFMDARKMTPKHLGPRQRWIAQTRISANRHGKGFSNLQKFVALTRPRRYAQSHPAFGDAFFHQERPAVYKDGQAISIALEISSDKLEALGRLVSPYLSEWSRQQFGMFIESRHPKKVCKHPDCRRPFTLDNARSQQRFCTPKCRDRAYRPTARKKARTNYARKRRPRV